MKDSFQGTERTVDNYWNEIAAAQDYIEKYLLQKTETMTKGYFYKLSKKDTFFFHESTVYPFVQLKTTIKWLLLLMDEDAGF